MRVKRLIGATFALCAIVAALALPASAAVKLPVELAAEKSFVFAKHTCAHDGNCIRYGVLNCNRQSLHVVLCRVFDERSTEAQGKYECNRLIRVALDPNTFRVQVTGLGPWHC
ncbi:MAG TPA: hypothetical protein VKC63_08690 [Solirubrobacterales bacterium]|nr:hypothetical protein [Solirubrobacterales bacterium]